MGSGKVVLLVMIQLIIYNVILYITEGGSRDGGADGTGEMRQRPAGKEEVRHEWCNIHIIQFNIIQFIIIIIIKRRSGVNPIPPTVKDRDKKETKAK